MVEKMNKYIILLVLVSFAGNAGYETGGTRSIPEWVHILEDPEKQRIAEPTTITPKCYWCSVSEETKQVGPDRWSCVQGHIMNQRGNPALLEIENNMKPTGFCPGEFNFYSEYVHNAVYESANFHFQDGTSLAAAADISYTSKTIYPGWFMPIGAVQNVTADFNATTNTATISSCSGLENGNYVLFVRDDGDATFDIDDYDQPAEIMRANCSGGTVTFLDPGFGSDPVRWLSTSGNTGIAHTDGVGDAETWVLGIAELYSGGPPAMNFCHPDDAFCPKDTGGDAWVDEYCSYIVNDWNIDCCGGAAGNTRSGLTLNAYIGDVDYHRHNPSHNPDAVNNNTVDKGVVTGSVPSGAGAESENYLSDGLDYFYSCLSTGASKPIIGGIWDAESFEGHLDGIQHEGSIGGDGDQRTVNRNYADKWGEYHRHTLIAVMDGSLSTALSKFGNYTFPPDVGTNRPPLDIRTAQSTATSGTTGTTLTCSGCTFTTWDVALGDRILNHDITKQDACYVDALSSETTLTMSVSGCIDNGDAFSITSNPTNSQRDTADAGTTGTTLQCNSCNFTGWSIASGNQIANLTTPGFCTVTSVTDADTLIMSSSGCVGQGDDFGIQPETGAGGTLIGNEQHTLEILASYALGVAWYSIMPFKDDQFNGNNDLHRRRALPFQFVYTDQSGLNSTYSYGESTMTDPRGTFATYAGTDLEDMGDTRGSEFMGAQRVFAIDLLTIKKSPELTVGNAHIRYSFDDVDADGCDTDADLEGWTSNLGGMTVAIESSDVYSTSPIANLGSARCALKITSTTTTLSINSERVRSPNTNFGVTANNYYLASHAAKITGPNVKWRPYTTRLEGAAWEEVPDSVMHDVYRFWPVQFKPGGTDTTVFYSFSFGNAEARDIMLEDVLVWEDTTPMMGLWLAVFDDDGAPPYKAAILVNLSGEDQTNISLYDFTGQCWQEPTRPSWDGSASSGATWTDPDNWMQGRAYCNNYPLLKNENARLFIPVQ